MCSHLSPYPAPFRLFPFHPTETTEIYTLSLHDALPISSTRRSSSSRRSSRCRRWPPSIATCYASRSTRSEEHTSELQSRFDLVCRLLLEKKKNYRVSDRRCSLRQCSVVGGWCRSARTCT